VTATPARYALALVLALVLSGCGYSSGARADRLPNIQTLAVPAFVNQTQTYRVEQVLTAAVVSEFLNRTKYKVVNEESESADATLRGYVVSTQIAPVTYDSNTGRASSSLITVTMRVSLTDRNGRVIFDNPNYLFREQYQVSREISSFFEEESPALERMSRDFARTLVSNILEAY
jgi:outer membrane lipopolysaccharide assembly protein LptE/RlpB